MKIKFHFFTKKKYLYSAKKFFLLFFSFSFSRISHICSRMFLLAVSIARYLPFAPFELFWACIVCCSSIGSRARPVTSHGAARPYTKRHATRERVRTGGAVGQKSNGVRFRSLRNGSKGLCVCVSNDFPESDARSVMIPFLLSLLPFTGSGGEREIGTREFLRWNLRPTFESGIFFFFLIEFRTWIFFSTDI